MKVFTSHNKGYLASIKNTGIFNQKNVLYSYKNVEYYY